MIDYFYLSEITNLMMNGMNMRFLGNLSHAVKVLEDFAFQLQAVYYDREAENGKSNSMIAE